MTEARMGWERRALGDVLAVKHGFAFRGEFFADDGPYVVLTPGNFHENGGFKPKSGKEKYYTAEPPAEFILAEGDLIVAMTEQAEGLLGSSALVPVSGLYLHNQRIGLVIVKAPQLADKRFVYYLFNTQGVRAQLQATATGSKVRHTAPTRIEAVEVLLPPLRTQELIGAVLEAYDELIENNTRRIRILEEMTQLVYREWFVEFRYPGRENVLLVDSDLGKIPVGWEAKALGELVDVDKGLSYKGAYLTDQGIPMANLKCFRPGGGFRREGTKPYSGEFKSKHAVRPGDVIVANTDLTQAGNVIGSPAVVPHRGFEGGGIISHHLFAVRQRDSDLDRRYLYHLLGDARFRNFARGTASGTTVLGFRSADFLAYQFPVPPVEIMNQFGDIADNLMELAEDLEDANENLRITRDLLLPRLISGELDAWELDLDVGDPAA